MDLQTSVRTVLQRKYADFTGRAQRSELWWFALFSLIVSAILQVLDGAILGMPVLGSLWSLGVLIPSIAVGVRRLHDRDMSGWWYLIIFIPVVGAIGLIVLFILEGTKGPNRFGADPLG